MHIVEPARPGEREAALQMVFAHLGCEESARRVSNALQLVTAGHLDPEGIHIARQDGELTGAIVGLSLVGGGGLLWLPGVRQGPQQTICEDVLVQSICTWLQTRGAKVIQAILSPAELSRADSLLSNHFQHVTQLLYLRHDLVNIPGSPDNPELAFQSYSPANDQAFRDTLSQTHEQTLDCPELNGVRSIDEIIEGHKAQGDFDPHRWWLIHANGKAAGIMMLTRVSETTSWDISYLGVIPSARGVGIGRVAVARAIQEAQLFGADQLTVAVDVRNTPARQLYQRLGFEPAATREVFLYFPTHPTPQLSQA